MAHGFMVPKGGAQGIAQEFSEIRRQQANTRGANNFESAVIGSGGMTVKSGGAVRLLDDNGVVSTLLELGFLFQADPLTGAAVQISNGQILMWGNLYGNPDNYGRLMTDPGDANLTRWFPPFSDGTGNENSITIQGRREGLPGNLWVYSDGSITLRVQDDDGTRIGGLNLAADRVDIDANKLGLYSLPTTSSGPNVHLGMVGGEWTAAYVTSSERYKQDIVDAPIDATAPLRWRPRWWRDRSEVAAIGDDADFHHGFIAEEIAEESPACVRYDDEGRPDSLRQMHMLAEVVALCQAQQTQIDELARQNADLTARLEALEAT